MDRAQPLPAECPFWSSRVTLGRVTHDRAVTYSNRVADKLTVLRGEAGRSVAATLFVAWTGQYSTDLFELTGADAARLLAEKLKK